MIPEHLRPDRSVPTERAEMQKLFVTGHLLPGVDLSAQKVKAFMEGLGPVCGMNIFNGPTVKTPDSYDPETFRRLGDKAPEDVNAIVMWDDSGAQMYIFPNKKNWFTLDIYTCKKFDANKALEYTYQELGLMEDMQFSTQDFTTNTAWKNFVKPDGTEINPERNFVPLIDRMFSIDFSNQDQIMTAGKSLEDVIAQAIQNGAGHRVAQSYTKEQVTVLRDIHSAYEIATDEKFMKDVLSGVVKDVSEYPFQETYNKLSQMEAKAAGMTKGRRVIHIGTGWPGTAIGLYQQFGILVTCIEKDPEVAEKSKAALEKLGLLGKDKLQVVCADGTEINPENYQAVIISAMVSTEDKKEVIRNMRKLEPGDGPLLVLRTPPDSARTLFYQPLPREITDNSSIELIGDTRSYVRSNDPLLSMIYRVKPTAEVRRGSDTLIVFTGAKLNRPQELLAA